MCGKVARKPKFTPEVATMMLLGPGVNPIEAMKGTLVRISAAGNGCITPDRRRRPPPGLGPRPGPGTGTPRYTQWPTPAGPPAWRDLHRREPALPVRGIHRY